MTAPAAALACDAALNLYALGQVRLDLSARREIELPAGTRFVHSYTTYESASRLIARPGEGAADGRDPDARRGVRSVRAQGGGRFVAIPVGSGVDTDQVLEQIATFAEAGGGCSRSSRRSEAEVRDGLEASATQRASRARSNRTA